MTGIETDLVVEVVVEIERGEGVEAETEKGEEVGAEIVVQMKIARDLKGADQETVNAVDLRNVKEDVVAGVETGNDPEIGRIGDQKKEAEVMQTTMKRVKFASRVNLIALDTVKKIYRTTMEMKNSTMMEMRVMKIKTKQNQSMAEILEIYYLKKF